PGMTISGISHADLRAFLNEDPHRSHRCGPTSKRRTEPILSRSNRMLFWKYFCTGPGNLWGECNVF
ncbi:hypothetical protein, partial [Leptospira interrogans]|uniref:hypothetical protein n=1 Tax=Leptospira interrogans TaxID=173 RepID=UPI0039F18451